MSPIEVALVMSARTRARDACALRTRASMSATSAVTSALLREEASHGAEPGDVAQEGVDLVVVEAQRGRRRLVARDRLRTGALLRACLLVGGRHGHGQAVAARAHLVLDARGVASGHRGQCGRRGDHVGDPHRGVGHDDHGPVGRDGRRKLTGACRAAGGRLEALARVVRRLRSDDAVDDRRGVAARRAGARRGRGRTAAGEAEHDDRERCGDDDVPTTGGSGGAGTTGTHGSSSGSRRRGCVVRRRSDVTGDTPVPASRSRSGGARAVVAGCDRDSPPQRRARRRDRPSRPRGRRRRRHLGPVRGMVPGPRPPRRARHRARVDDPRSAGALRVAELEGLALDEGAESVLATRPEAVGLIRDVGLGADLVHPAVVAPRLLIDGDLRPMPRGLVMGVPTDLGELSRSGVLGPRALAQLPLDHVRPGHADRRRHLDRRVRRPSPRPRRRRPPRLAAAARGVRRPRGQRLHARLRAAAVRRRPAPALRPRGGARGQGAGRRRPRTAVRRDPRGSRATARGRWPSACARAASTSRPA